MGIAATVVLAAAALGLAGALTANRAAAPALCVFRRVTGIPCPGCGLVRAAGLLLRGEISAAFAVNPLGALALAVAPPVALAWISLRALAVSATIEPSRWEARLLPWAVGSAAAANWFYLVVAGRS